MSQLSYSSSLLLGECQTKYYHHKVAKTPRDYEFETSRALIVGKVVHEVAEDLMHLPTTDEKLEGLIARKLQEYAEEDPEALSYFPLAYAMSKKYLDFHVRAGMEVVFCEFALSDDNFIGYIDIILKDKDENFYISDLKTKARFDIEKDGPLLTKDLQLHLYGNYHQQIKDYFKLKGEFKGYLYRVVKTPLIRQKRGESRPDFLVRLQDNVTVTQVFIPHKQSVIEEVKEFFDSALETKAGLENGEVPTRNYSACVNKYGSVCAWFSHCHDDKHEETKLDVLTSCDLDLQI